MKILEIDNLVRNYKIAKMDAFASKLAGRLFSPFCMARSVHKIFTKELALTY